MNFQQARNTLKQHGLEIFTTQEFVNVTGLSREIAQVKLARYKKLGYLVSPRKSVYYLKGEVEDKFKIASKVYSPSYISLDSAMSKHGIIPETVYTVTSVTTKASREFRDEQTTYRFYRIKKQAFAGYHKENDALLADPEKAIADYLYFVALGKRELNDRMNLSKINKDKVMMFAKFFDNKRLNKIIKKIFI